METDQVLLRTAPAQRPPAARETPRVDLGPLVQAIARELRAAVPATRIEAVLLQLLERDFRDARVIAFVPILLQRAACEALRRELPPRESADA